MKKLIIWLLVAGFVITLFTAPTQAADEVKLAAGIVYAGLSQIGIFLKALVPTNG
jgi:hypothetical protein